MKQKIVIKVCTMCCDKCRAEAMAVAAAMGGVESVAIDGKHRDQLVVVGECVDSVELTSALRNKMRHAGLLSFCRTRHWCADILEVSEVKPPPPPKPVAEVKKDDKKPPPPPPPVTFVCHHCCHPVGYGYYSCYCYCSCHYH